MTWRICFALRWGHLAAMGQRPLNTPSKRDYRLKKRMKNADDLINRMDKKLPTQAFVLGWPLKNMGGVNEVVRNLIRQYECAGAIAPMVIEATDQPSNYITAEGTPVIGIPFPAVYDARRPIASLFKFLVRAPFFLLKLRSVCRAHSIEVLNPHFIGMEHFPLVMLRRLGLFHGRLFLSFHGSDIREMIQAKGLRRRLFRLLLRGADALIPCSRGLGEEILMLAPECAERIVPIPNGIDIAYFMECANPAYPLPEVFERRRRLLSIGAFEYKKGHNVLVKAFDMVRRSHPDVCLVIVGQTREEFGATKQLIADLQLADDVLLLQDIPHANIAPLLKSSNIFVLSSRWEKGVCGEGFAMAILEAAALQKPVVSTLSCGVAEIIEHGVSGLIVPPESPELLARAIRELLDDSEAASRQAKRLHGRVSQEFTWNTAYQQYHRLATFH